MAGSNGKGNDQVATVAKALAHPLRVEMVRELRGSAEPISPNGFHRSHDWPLGNVAYHLRALESAGVVEVVKTEPRRGAVEHYFALRGRNQLAVLAALDAMDGSAY